MTHHLDRTKLLFNLPASPHLKKSRNEELKKNGGVRLSKREIQGLNTTDDLGGRKKTRQSMEYNTKPPTQDTRCRTRLQSTQPNIFEHDNQEEMMDTDNEDHGHRLLPAGPLKKCIQDNLCCSKCAEFHVVSTLMEFCNFLSSDTRNPNTSFYKDKLQQFLAERKGGWQPFSRVSVKYNQIYMGTEMTIQCAWGNDRKKAVALTKCPFCLSVTISVLPVFW